MFKVVVLLIAAGLVSSQSISTILSLCNKLPAPTGIHSDIITTQQQIIAIACNVAGVNRTFTPGQVAQIVTLCNELPVPTGVQSRIITVQQQVVADACNLAGEEANAAKPGY